MRFETRTSVRLALWIGGAAALAGSVTALPQAGIAAPPHGFFEEGPFRRIASFPVFLNTDVDDETVAEIVTASSDGNTLIYTDSQTENIGFVDITDPANPIANIVVGDGTVNLDPEGIVALADGSFWVVSEGTGNLVAGVSEPEERPFEGPNALVHVAANGDIVDVVFLPLSLTQNQFRFGFGFGFEGVTTDGSALFVAFQRAWENAGDPADRARIGRYDLASGEWTFAHYVLDAATSPTGGWVGLSDLTHLGGDDFAVIERDNLGGPDAAVKRLYTLSTAGVTFQAAVRPRPDSLAGPLPPRRRSLKGLAARSGADHRLRLRVARSDRKAVTSVRPSSFGWRQPFAARKRRTQPR